MRWIFIPVLALLTSMLFSSVLFAGKPATGCHPIVDACCSELFGGWVDGKWIQGEQMRPLIKGGETYRLYTATRFLGTATGGKFHYSESDEEQLGAASIKIALPDAIKNDEENKGQQIFGVYGDWNALPRIPEALSPESNTYQEAVRAILRQHKLPNAPVNITKILRVDLEGDGKDEVIIAATVMQDAREDEDGLYPAPWAKQNDYSFVVLRKVVKNKVATIPLVENYYPRSDSTEKGESSAPSVYTLEAVLDVNGDGVLEIITGWRWYEGRGKAVYQMKTTTRGAIATEVLWSGFSV
ncbi:MAG: hypothetical protein ACYDCO_23905 [Armatimonadota bacterium]